MLRKNGMTSERLRIILCFRFDAHRVGSIILYLWYDNSCTISCTIWWKIGVHGAVHGFRNRKCISYSIKRKSPRYAIFSVSMGFVFGGERGIWTSSHDIWKRDSRPRAAVSMSVYFSMYRSFAASSPIQNARSTETELTNNLPTIYHYFRIVLHGFVFWWRKKST